MIKKVFFSLVLSLLGTSYLCAYDFAVQNADGVRIYYKRNGTNVSVAEGSSLYTGKVVIPETVTYSEITFNEKYIVTDIERYTEQRFFN